MVPEENLELLTTELLIIYDIAQLVGTHLRGRCHVMRGRLAETKAFIPCNQLFVRIAGDLHVLDGLVPVVVSPDLVLNEVTMRDLVLRRVRVAFVSVHVSRLMNGCVHESARVALVALEVSVPRVRSDVRRAVRESHVSAEFVAVDAPPSLE
jgi:hypothetical protein